MAKFQRDDRDDERNESGRPETTGGNAVLLVVLAVVGGGVLLACLVGVAAMFLYTSRAEVREAHQAQDAAMEAEKAVPALAFEEREEVRDFREKVAHYLAESRAAIKVMTDNPSVEDAKKTAGRIDDLRTSLPDVPPEIDQTGKVFGRLSKIRGSFTLAAEYVRLRAGYAELGDKKKSDEMTDRLAKMVADATAAADEVEVMVKAK